MRDETQIALAFLRKRAQDSDTAIRSVSGEPMRTATLQQMAAALVESSDTQVRFNVQQSAGAWILQLCGVHDGDLALTGVRNTAIERRFASIESAITMARNVARQAGLAPDHSWNPHPDSLHCMPSIMVHLEPQAAGIWRDGDLL